MVKDLAPFKLRITSFTGEYRFLSNFYPCQWIEYEGMIFKTVEHAFQAAKTDSHRARWAIQQCASPAAAKAMGKRVSLRPDWDVVKVGIMGDLLALKFAEKNLRAQLLGTGDAELIEGNSWGDRFWGQCPVGNGENWLGKLLMDVRADLVARGFKPTELPALP